MIEDVDTLARRSAVQNAITAELPIAERCVAIVVIPSISDSKRQSALHEAVADLDIALARGHRDVEQELTHAAAILVGWLEQRAADAASAPVSSADWDGR